MSIYKFVHEDRIDILENFKIRFTQPQEFNDPFEMYPYIESIFKTGFFNKAISEQSSEDYEHYYIKSIHDILNIIPNEKRINLPEDVWLAFGKLLRPIMEPLAKDFVNVFMQQFAILFHNVFPSSLNNSIGVLCTAKRYDDLRMWGHYSRI